MSLAALLRRDQQRQQEKTETAEAIAFDIAMGLASEDDIESRCEAAGITVAKLAPLVQTIELRRSQTAKADAEDEAKSEVERLKAEIDLVNSEVAKKLAPLRKKRAILEAELVVAERRSRVDHQRCDKMKSTAPDWIKNERRRNREQLNELQSQRQYSARRVAHLSEQIEELETELAEIPNRIALYIGAAVGDVEAKRQVEKLRRRKAQIESSLSNLRDSLKSPEKDREMLEKAISAAHAREQEIDQFIMTKVWPAPSDLQSKAVQI